MQIYTFKLHTRIIESIKLKIHGKYTKTGKLRSLNPSLSQKPATRRDCRSRVMQVGSCNFVFSVNKNTRKCKLKWQRIAPRTP